MTQDEIIAMVKEAYGPITGKWWDMDVASFERFAKLVAAHEREACAKVCNELLSMVSTGDEHMDGVWDCISAIRARGQS